MVSGLLGYRRLLLAILTNLLWVRGTESNWRVRMQLADARFSGTSRRGRVRLCAADGWRRRLHLLQHAHPEPVPHQFSMDEARAQYEKKYQQYWALPQPRITDVTTNVDIYPEKRSVVMHGTLWLENKTSPTLIAWRSRFGPWIWFRFPANISKSTNSALSADRRPSSKTRRSASTFQAAEADAAARSHSAGLSICNMTIRASRIRSRTPTSSTMAPSSTTGTGPISVTRRKLS